MDHYYTNIQGWFHSPTLFRMIVEEAVDGARFVEIGVWKGQSTAFMGVEIENSGKIIHHHAVDHFLGEEGEPGHQDDPILQSGKLYDVFCANIEPIRRHVTPIRNASVEAALLFDDESLDFVFVDGAHDYDSVVADIGAWLPKIKPGGVIAGDDYYHPNYNSVQRAVTHMLPHYAVIKEPSSRRNRTEYQTWVYRKGSRFSF